MGSKKKLAADTRREMHFLSNQETEKWIKDYVERESALAREHVEDAETVFKQEQEERWSAANTGLTINEPEKSFEVTMIAIGDGLNDHVTSDEELDREDVDNYYTRMGNLCEDDEPAGWWAQPPSPYSSTCRYFGRSRLTN